MKLLIDFCASAQRTAKLTFCIAALTFAGLSRCFFKFTQFSHKHVKIRMSQFFYRMSHQKAAFMEVAFSISLNFHINFILSSHRMPILQLFQANDKVNFIKLLSQAYWNRRNTETIGRQTNYKPRMRIHIKLFFIILPS